MQQLWEAVSLEAIDGGRVLKQANYEIEKALENIKDPNTSPEQVRTVVVKLKFKPESDRKSVNVTYHAESKLASDVPGTELIRMGPDGCGFVSSMEQLDLPSSLEDQAQATRLVPKSNGGES